MYLPMCIYEVKTKFLNDTGAEVTIMSQKLFERIPENLRPNIVKTECNVKLEVPDKGLVQVIGVADISFCAGSHMYTWHVLIAPIEGLLGMDLFPLSHSHFLVPQNLVIPWIFITNWNPYGFTWGTYVHCINDMIFKFFQEIIHIICSKLL